MALIINDLRNYSIFGKHVSIIITLQMADFAAILTSYDYITEAQQHSSYLYSYVILLKFVIF